MSTGVWFVVILLRLSSASFCALFWGIAHSPLVLDFLSLFDQYLESIQQSKIFKLSDYIFLFTVFLSDIP